MSRSTLPLLALLCLALPTHAQTPEWPGRRGPTDNGVAASDVNPPLEWNEDLNVRWKVELPGLGNSSPIIRGDRIYLTTAIDTAALEGEGRDPEALIPAQPGPPHADGMHQFVVFALDRADGETVWRTVVNEERPHEKGHLTGSHASASIHCDGERLVAFLDSEVFLRGHSHLYCIAEEG